MQCTNGDKKRLRSVANVRKVTNGLRASAGWETTDGQSDSSVAAF
uniref:Uncharacterized protein n=1 Tax=Peronospora matthiolae TaxID=2874970 RepID=A0AAV1SZK4_9STRA